jgi:hypothetical protein
MPPRELESKSSTNPIYKPNYKPQEYKPKERTNRALRQPAAETHQELQTIIVITKNKQDNEKKRLQKTKHDCSCHF